MIWGKTSKAEAQEEATTEEYSLLLSRMHSIPRIKKNSLAISPDVSFNNTAPIVKAQS